MSEDVRDERPLIETTASVCQRCGTQIVSSYHTDGECDGLVVRIGDEWRCAGCGVAIRRSDDCPECGASDAAASVTVGVDLRPGVGTPALEARLRQEITRGASGTLARDSHLERVARTHSFETVEHQFYATNGTPRDLQDRIDDLSVPIGSYRTQELVAYPDPGSAGDITEELFAECNDALTPDDDPTHVGVGATFNPNGGIHLTLVFAERVTISCDPLAIETAVHDTVNDRRRAHDLGTLSFDHHLAGIARGHSRDMARRDYFDHESPDGRTTMDRYERADYPPRPSAENISKRYPADADPRAIAENVVEGWMNSRGHRENIVEDAWDSEGIGVYQGDDGALLVTQNFS